MVKFVKDSLYLRKECTRKFQVIPGRWFQHLPTSVKLLIINKMVNFIGEYTAKADDKGRLVFPSAFKAVMPADGDMRFVLKKDIFEDCLEMYTYE